MSDEKKTFGKPFVKGQTGNAGGRPKGYERQLREVVEGMTAVDPTLDAKQAKGAPEIPAWQAIVKRAVIDAVAGDKYARDFVADRLMGKPKQTVDARITDNAPRRDWSQVALDERVRLLETIQAVPLVSGEQPDDERVH